MLSFCGGTIAMPTHCCVCSHLISTRVHSWRCRPPGEGHGAAEEPKLRPADDVVARGIVGCALAALQLALEGAGRAEGLCLSLRLLGSAGKGRFPQGMLCAR